MNTRPIRFIQHLFSILLAALLLVTLGLGVVLARGVQTAQAAGSAHSIYLPLILKGGSTPVITSTPAQTRTATPSPTNTPTPTSTATQAIGIANGDFEQILAGWTRASSSGHYGLIGTGDSLGSAEITPRVDPRSGIYMARLGGFNYEINEIYQTVTLPNNTPLYLIFYYQIRGDPGSECNALWGALVQIYIGGQKVFNPDYFICKNNATSVWTRGVVDISAIHGQTVLIVFHVESAHSAWNYIYLDDIALGPTP